MGCGFDTHRTCREPLPFLPLSRQFPRLHPCHVPFLAPFLHHSHAEPASRGLTDERRRAERTSAAGASARRNGRAERRRTGRAEADERRGDAVRLSLGGACAAVHLHEGGAFPVVQPWAIPYIFTRGGYVLLSLARGASVGVACGARAGGWGESSPTAIPFGRAVSGRWGFGGSVGVCGWGAGWG